MKTMNFATYIEEDSSYHQQPVISTNEIVQLRTLARQSEQLRLNALTTHVIHKLMALDPEHREQYAERLARNNNEKRDHRKAAWLN